MSLAWTDDAGDHTAPHRYSGVQYDAVWTIPTGNNVRTKWVEMKAEK